MNLRERRQPNDESGTPFAEETSVSGLLKLLAAGPTGPILMALGPRPLRTRKLTERVPTYTPRTLYRHSRKLTELQLIDRRETEGVPSTVIHSLNNPRGRDLFRLLDCYATAALRRESGGRIDGSLWTACGLLGEMWASGWVDQLSREGRSPTELAEDTPGMTFHQVNRRTQQLISWDLLYETTSRGHRKRYHLSHQTRQGMALLAGLGRWRGRHVLRGGEGGLSAAETATVLRVCLPLIVLPEHKEMRIRLGVVGTADDCEDSASETLSGSIGASGKVRSVRDSGAADAWALGTVNTWLAAILDGNRGRLRVGGDLDLVDCCLRQLYEVLWTAPVRVGVG